MLKLKNKIATLIKRPAFVLLASVVLLWICAVNFNSVLADQVSAELKSVSVSPASFTVDGGDLEGWKGGEQALINDMASLASIDEFSQADSAYLRFGNLIDGQPVGSTVKNEIKVVAVPTEPSTASVEIKASDSAAQTEQLAAQSEQAPTTEKILAESEGQSEQPVRSEEVVQAEPAVAVLLPTEPKLEEHAIIFKDFSLPFESQGEAIANVQLRLSLAAKQQGASGQLKIYYKTGETWQDGGILQVRDGLNNQTNSGFFLFALPAFATWEELRTLEVKLVFLGDVSQSAAEIYLDATWLEIDYQKSSVMSEMISEPADTGSSTEAEAVEAVKGSNYEISLISPDTVFRTADNPDFNFVYKRKQGLIGSFMSGLFGLIRDPYAGLDIKARVKDNGGNEAPIGTAVEYLSNGEFHVRVTNRPRQFRPGRFTIEIEVVDGGEVKTQQQAFDWGVLAINASKTVYLSTETAYLQMGVLTETGDTICDADLFLEVTAPDGGVAYLDTYNGLVVRDPRCGPNNVIDVPDYFAHYGLAGTGTYKMKLTAHTKNGSFTIYDQFEVRDSVDIDIERTGPTRIWPLADYKMQFKVKASSSAEEFFEVVPKHFIIKAKELKLNGSLLVEGRDYEFENYPDKQDGMVLRWHKLRINEGDILELMYTFDAPDVSPEFYLLGPARVGGFEEVRQWQIASDAVTVVAFTAGSNPGVPWTNPTNAWTGDDGNLAVRTVSGATNDVANYLKGSTNNASTTDPRIITKVEIGFDGTTNDFTTVQAGMRALLNGVSTTSQQNISFTYNNGAEITQYVDITSASSTWTWSNIANLDVLIHIVNSGGNTKRLRVDQIYIRVTTANPPTNFINSVAQKKDGSGLVDIQTTVSDVDADNARMKVEYEAGATCAFTVPRDPFIATTGTSSTIGTFQVDNALPHQIGSTTATSSSILTTSANTLDFDWDTKNAANETDLTAADGVYCLRVTANDGTNDASPATIVVTLDNVKPTVPGALSLATTSVGNEIGLTFGATSSDTNFKEYKIFYKAGTSGVTEADALIGSSTVPGLGFADFNGATSTLLSDLLPHTDYVFIIWAYDQYGNKASSSEATIRTGKAAPVRANTVSYYAGQWTTSDGVSGQTTNTDQVFNAFNFALAETNAKIENAYVMFEANFNSYNPSTTTSGYKLAFDSCQEPCTANAFAGTGNKLKYDTTVLSYRSTVNGANSVRLLLDVTEEAQLAAYDGNGQLLEGQVGYRLESSAAITSISAAKAKLIVTYKYYDSLSPSYTNTVVYPLESASTTQQGPDTGTMRNSQPDDCVKGSSATGTCPLFNYNMALPELKASSSQWFETYNINSGNTTADVNITANIQGTDQDIAQAYIHEAVLNGGQSSLPAVYLADVPGFAENIAQQLEYRAGNPATTYNYFLLGGEVYETYFASTSDPSKTRTVSYPLGIVSTTSPTSKTPRSVSVYFPENGLASGTVTIKKAWLRIKGHYNGNLARTMTVSSKVGNNAESASAVYNLLLTSAPKPAFTIIHVIPSADYAQLAAANGAASTSVTLYTTVSNAVVGGTAAELMITYSYSGESNGRLASLNLYGGQSALNGNAQLATTSDLRLVLPEPLTNKAILAGGLLTSYLLSDSDLTLPAAGTDFLLGAALSTTSAPTCTNAFVAEQDAMNAFAEYYGDITTALNAVNGQNFYTCQSNNGAGDASAGAKMNSQLYYTYRYNPPTPELSQNNWRWYQNGNALEAAAPFDSEITPIGNINNADILRLRLNVDVLAENISTSSQIFKLQYGSSSDCFSIAEPDWFDVGTSTGNAVWRAFDNASVADGSSTGLTVLSDSDKYESYEENNPTAANPYSLNESEIGEWDWTLYNNNASSTQNYCFRMVYNDGTAFDDYQSYPRLLTAASNTVPINPFGLGQSRNSTTTLITNGAWINESGLRLAASTTDVNINQSLRLFFELATSSANLRTATSVPAGACAYGTAWAGCPSRVWAATSSVGDYRVNPFSTTTSITALPQYYAPGYVWQAMACDNFGLCSDWSAFGAEPNFKVDLTAPTAPGALTLGSLSPTSVTLAFGAATAEDNFAQYKIFYKIGTTSVTESNLPWVDANLGYIDYGFAANGATSTTVTGLIAGTTYAFNIWAYDLAGNVASATQILVATTTSSFTPPTGNFNSSPGQWLDGSGGVNLSVTMDDPDNDNTLRARIQYEAGMSCAFSSASTTVLNPATSTITATNLPKPNVDNQAFYQLGTSTGYILTAPGPNTVTFDWLSKNNIDDMSGTYCLRLVANDGLFDSATTTKLVFVDNIDPAVPGALSSSSVKATNVTLNFGAPSADADNYAIYYGTSSPITEADYMHADPNLASQNFNNAATTTISGLIADTVYYINIWAYDYYGNRASSTQVSVKTDAYPSAPAAINQYKANGASATANGSWTTEDTVKLVASTTDTDTDEVLALYFELIASSSAFTTATTVPSGACAPALDYPACASRIWVATSSPGDYSITPFTATATITNIPDSASGYKWQVLACDAQGECSAWTKFNPSAPNFKVDTVAPTAPGAFALNSKTSVSVTLDFGATTSETNFSRYRLFYSTSSTATYETDFEQTDNNLNYIDYNGATTITVNSLRASTTYYFNLWAYDQAGQLASSSRIAMTTNEVKSTPGVVFYAKASSTLYYRVWNGTDWGVEQVGPDMGTAGTVAVRHISTLASDDRGKIAILVKSHSNNNQQWWAVVYRVAANDFVNKTQLDGAQANNTAATQITGCIGALSSGEFFIIRNNNGTASISTRSYRWNSAGGWTALGTVAALDTGSQLYGGCQLVRRPNTDNHLLLMYNNARRVYSAYYNGTSTYSNSWTGLQMQGTVAENNVSNYVGEGFYDRGANDRGAFYTGTGANPQLAATYFNNPTDTTISYGGPVNTPAGADAWSAQAIQGEFSQDPGAIGIAYLTGRDIAVANQLNVYRLDITSGSPVWSTTTNGINVNMSAGMYSQGNFSQKPFTLNFYKYNKALLSWTLNAGAAPRYKVLNALTNSIDAASSTVPGASTTATWNRVRLYQDPNDIQTLAVYQNTAKDYGAIFWDGDNEQFYSTGSSSWRDIATSSGVANANDSATSFNYTAGNASPNAPINLAQFRSNGTTTIVNGDWTNQSTVVLRLAAKDPDTSEIVKLYLELVDNDTAFTVSDSVPSSPCASTTAYTACAGKIWQIATSSLGDYSVTPFTATATITNIPDSTTTAGYKWQVLACDDSGDCSGWQAFNATAPNFRVDTTNPTDPGNLTITDKTSNSVTLKYATSTTEVNFATYKIYYKAAASGVAESDSQWIDSDLGFINYNNTATTTVTGLASSTQYVFRIWAYDLAGNKSSSSAEVATTTNAGPSIFETSFIFENDDGANVDSNSASVAASTTLTNINKGERFAVRIQLENRGGDVLANKSYKLQFSTSSLWYDVGAGTPVAYSAGLAGSSGSALTGPKASANANIWTNGAWYANTGASNNFSLANAYYSELEFVLQNALAVAGSGYDFRLYNATDNKVLDGYLNYPRMTVAAASTVRFSKGTYASLPGSYNDLTYYLDRKGYGDVAADDNSLRDSATSTGNFPVFNFLVKNATNTQAITGLWNGQSSVDASSKPVYLQIYHFGTTNAWVTVASNTSATANTDFTLTGTINAKLSEHYDALNFAYWRVYQESGSETLRTDYATSTFSAPVPEVIQKHFRWRENNGTEATAAWLEAEDIGSPTASTSMVKYQIMRLRLSAANLGGGTAAEYRYQLEYSTTSLGCALETGSWFAVPTDNSREFRMSTTTTFADQANTGQRLANAEGYTFVAGKMVRDPSNKTASTTLSEGRYVENEFALFANANATDGATYCFRMVDNRAAATPLDGYDRYAEITIAGNSNAAPVFVTNTSDGGSGTTSPTNEGDQIVFTATGDDSDGDDYYLAVCQAAGINPGNNGAPTCKFGTWCVSAAASSTAENTCAYTVATSTQIAEWYSYVCDGRPGTGVAKCSPFTQGGYGTDEDSPFFVNHRPAFTSVSTDFSSTTPGGTLTILTGSNEADTVNGQDMMSLFVCRTNDANAAGCTYGAGDTVCQSLQSTSTNISCQFTVPNVATSGSFSYYAFVFDNHGLNASANSRNSSYNISNVAPTLGSVVLNGGSDIQLNLRGDVDKPVSFVAQISDLNGCNDIGSLLGKVYMTGTSSTCNTNDRNVCYAAVSPAQCVLSGCVGGSALADYTCTVNMKYYAVSTDDINASTSAYKWKANFNVYDLYGNLTPGSSTEVELLTNMGLAIDQPVVNFGMHNSSATSTGAVNQQTTVVNAANSPINTNLYGSDMFGDIGGDSIAVNYLQWRLSSTFNYGLGNPLTDAGNSVDVLSHIYKTATSTDSFKNFYWGVGFPVGLYPAAYNGSTTFTAIIDNTGWSW